MKQVLALKRQWEHTMCGLWAGKILVIRCPPLEIQTQNYIVVKLLKHLVKLKKRLINQGQAIFATHLRPGLRGPDSCWFVNAIIFLMLDST